MATDFDSKAREMDAHPVIRDIALKFSDQIKKKVPLDASLRVLDFGCGSGLIGMHICGHVGTLVMVDSSRVMHEILAEKIEENKIDNIETRMGELDALEMEESSFDIVYSNNVLHHVKETEPFLRRLVSLVKPGGRFFVGDLVTEDGSFHDDNTGVEHFGFSPEELVVLLGEAGLEDCGREEYYVVKKPVASGEIVEFPMFFIRGKRPS